MPDHHPVFMNYTPWTGTIPAGFEVNFLGVRTRGTYFPLVQRDVLDRDTVATRDYPPVSEEYFEWIDLLTAVEAATDRLVMMELGAGWGRWLVNGAVAARVRKRVPSNLIGLEADPGHFQMMQQHFSDNGLDPQAHRLLRSAVDSQDGIVLFGSGHSEEWYGQALVANVKQRDPKYPREKVACVRAYSLCSLLAQIPSAVDLIDLDVQGVEDGVLAAAEDSLTAQVKRVHIGTHGASIETNLRALFSRLGWAKVFDFPCGSTVETDYGRVAFQDGVQSWFNPRVGTP